MSETPADTPHETPDEEHVASRAELLPEEQRAGSDDPHAQAEEILEESDERTLHPEETRRESTQTPDQARGVTTEPPPT